MEFIASGSQADVYKKDNMAVKLFKRNVSKGYIEYEMNLQKMAFDLGLPVPKIYDFVEIDGKCGILMEYVNGIPFGKIIQNDINQLNKYLIESIEIQINLNKITAKYFPSMKDKLFGEINCVEIIPDDKKQKIMKLLNNMSFNQYLCHGDFQFMNILLTPYGIKIIDWIASSSGNVEADIYRTYLLYRVYNIELAELFMENYCKKANVPKANIIMWAPIIAAARLSEGISKEENEKIIKIIDENI
jgi:tRNA A-37 threonylcarbamoyl transferase component Bud32